MKSEKKEFSQNKDHEVVRNDSTVPIYKLKKNLMKQFKPASASIHNRDKIVNISLKGEAKNGFKLEFFANVGLRTGYRNIMFSLVRNGSKEMEFHAVLPIE